MESVPAIDAAQSDLTAGEQTFHCGCESSFRNPFGVGMFGEDFWGIGLARAGRNRQIMGGKSDQKFDEDALCFSVGGELV